MKNDMKENESGLFDELEQALYSVWISMQYIYGTEKIDLDFDEFVIWLDNVVKEKMNEKVNS